MKKRAVFPLLLVPFMATSCFADSLLITYRSGNTQTVNLDESVGNISSTEYRSSQPPAAGSAPPPAQEPKVEKKQESSSSKGGVRVKWAPARSGD